MCEKPVKIEFKPETMLFLVFVNPDTSYEKNFPAITSSYFIYLSHFQVSLQKQELKYPFPAL